jgi:hypothetical protein
MVNELIKKSYCGVMKRSLITGSQTHKGLPIIHRYRSGIQLSKGKLKIINKLVHTKRLRLMDISWFFKKLNETIARDA